MKTSHAGEDKERLGPLPSSSTRCLRSRDREGGKNKPCDTELRRRQTLRELPLVWRGQKQRNKREGESSMGINTFSQISVPLFAAEQSQNWDFLPSAKSSSKVTIDCHSHGQQSSTSTSTFQKSQRKLCQKDLLKDWMDNFLT
nr:hypothetical protein CFP56_40771 [Quercus suber]